MTQITSPGRGHREKERTSMGRAGNRYIEIREIIMKYTKLHSANAAAACWAVNAWCQSPCAPQLQWKHNGHSKQEQASGAEWWARPFRDCSHQEKRPSPVICSVTSMVWHIDRIPIAQLGSAALVFAPPSHSTWLEDAEDLDHHQDPHIMADHKGKSNVHQLYSHWIGCCSLLTHAAILNRKLILCFRTHLYLGGIVIKLTM